MQTQLFLGQFFHASEAFLLIRNLFKSLLPFPYSLLTGLKLFLQLYLSPNQIFFFFQICISRKLALTISLIQRKLFTSACSELRSKKALLTQQLMDLIFILLHLFSLHSADLNLVSERFQQNLLNGCLGHMHRLTITAAMVAM